LQFYRFNGRAVAVKALSWVGEHFTDVCITAGKVVFFIFYRFGLTIDID